ncbi:MAG: threonine--tRNA ligase, partial [Parvularculaceae bacterium]
MKDRAMVAITLPDGSIRKFDGAVVGTALAESISKSLAKKAIAMKVDGVLTDLFAAIDRDAKVIILTREDPEALDLIRHDTAHLLAQAVQELFPGTQVTIGPNVEDGFYYDFARPEPFSTDDFAKIEKRMAEIVDEDRPTRLEIWNRADAIKRFKSIGEMYKAEIIADLPKEEAVRVYFHGPWHDLCRGPHLPSTKHIGKAFKLMKLAGAYWRGDHRNAMLQRIYGTAWTNEADLKAYLTRLEEAEKRDHRRIGKEMDLFHIQEEAVGQVFWHPKGWTLWRALENYIRRKVEKDGYREVKTPQLVDRKLWEQSGHWENYRPNMFIAEVDEGADKPGRVLALKPMNCPGHVQIFRQGLKSYRDLPLRMAEFGGCHRYEPSGALHGIMRVRGFVQDDGHIFCTEEQFVSETERFVKLLTEVYRELGFDSFTVKFATRPTPRGGTEEQWDKAEAALEGALKTIGLAYTINPGEGTFYAPKLEFVLRDAIGRDWQCGTIQLDYVLPERLDAEYVAEDGTKKRPIMLHRAIVGSLERFIGVLIEHHAGKFPLWLAPVQVVVTTITSDADDYAASVAAAFKAKGLRVETDFRNEKINYKVREHSHAKVPVIAVVGAREAEEK